MGWHDMFCSADGAASQVGAPVTSCEALGGAALHRIGVQELDGDQQSLHACTRVPGAQQAGPAAGGPEGCTGQAARAVHMH